MSTKVVTGLVRFSYVQLFTPNKDGKYSVTLLIPKLGESPEKANKTLSAIDAAIKEARENYCKKHGENALPEKPVTTIHDGDGLRDNGEPFGEECKGCFVLRVSTTKPPVIVNREKENISNPEELYSGCYGRAAINFFGYNSNGKKGISAGLLSIQKVRDGEPLGITGSANDFDDTENVDDYDDLPF